MGSKMADHTCKHNGNIGEMGAQIKANEKDISEIKADQKDIETLTHALVTTMAQLEITIKSIPSPNSLRVWAFAGGMAGFGVISIGAKLIGV